MKSLMKLFMAMYMKILKCLMKRLKLISLSYFKKRNVVHLTDLMLGVQMAVWYEIFMKILLIFKLIYSRNLINQLFIYIYIDV